MDSDAPVDWHPYNRAASARPARRLVAQAIAAAPGEGPGRVAIEIGAGGGSDALEFARRGWTVHAYDIDDTLASRLVENERLPGEVVLHHVDASTVEEFPQAAVIYSAYSLPMLGPDGLERIWPRLLAALERRGVLAVDLFGENDSWGGRPDIATLSAQRIGEMFRGFQILDRSIRDEDGRTFSGDRKHWHVISTLARRLA